MRTEILTRSEQLLEKLQILTPERQQQLLDFAEFLVQQQQLSNGKQLSESSIADSPSGSWVDQVSGSFKDDPEFEEVLRYGREFRRSDYPGDEDQQADG